MGRSTADAMSRVREIVNNANGREQARNLFVGMLTLDVKNAFNSAPWAAITGALVREGVPGYPMKTIGGYLSDRTLNVRRADGSSTTRKDSGGVP